MKANLKKIRKHRFYSDDFKKNLVKDFESGRFSVIELGQLHGIAPMVIYRWIYKFSIFNKKGFRVVEMKDSSHKKVKDLTERIKELERMVGQKQIKIDYLEKMIDIAKDELNIDIKKNYNTPPSSGSDHTKKR